LSQPHNASIEIVLFDFGGVLAEEGFREGLKAIGRMHGLDADSFFETAARAVYESGYVVGRATESDFWALVKQRTGITAPEEALRAEIFRHFILRPWMLDVVGNLRRRGYMVGILSDQTDWLDRLDEQYGFFKEFHSVFNSYYLGVGKKDPAVFDLVVMKLGCPPSHVLFIDDHPGNIERAGSRGLRTILYSDRSSFLDELKSLHVLE